MNMLDAEARQDLQRTLIEHFEPLGLRRFIIIGFDASEHGFVWQVPPLPNFTPEDLKEALRQIAEGLDTNDPIEFKDVA
jgi:hypothetical protein